MPDTTVTAFRIFLRYLYSDVLEVDTSNVLEILHLSRLYLMPHLEKLCLDFVRQHISLATALPWYVWADAHR